MDLNLVGTIVAVILTVMVFTYLLGDNPVFRLAEHYLVLATQTPTPLHRSLR